jgi:transcription elongation factor GreA
VHNLKETSAHIDRLLNEERRETLSDRENVLKRVQKEQSNARNANEHGDRSENAEWQTAVETLAGLNRVLLSLNERLQAYEKYEKGYQQSGYIGIRTTVQLSGAVFPDGDYICKLVPEGLGNAGIGAVSETTPVGKALLGRKIGDRISVKDNFYTIADIL